MALQLKNKPKFTEEAATLFVLPINLSPDDFEINIAPDISQMYQSKDKTITPNFVPVKKDSFHVKDDQRTVTISPVDGTTDRRVRSHPPQCITSREVRQIVRMAVTSRAIAQHIESLMHHSVSARTIRRRFQQRGLSSRLPLLGLPLTQSHKRFHRQ
ncbi:hypothetical protein TNCV_3523481 [Trichonephila clavipes]|nr:hypothetical protein TNCV_3523481 [Trichonephila clavipes]